MPASVVDLVEIARPSSHVRFRALQLAFSFEANFYKKHLFSVRHSNRSANRLTYG